MFLEIEPLVFGLNKNGDILLVWSKIHGPQLFLPLIRRVDSQLLTWEAVDLYAKKFIEKVIRTIKYKTPHLVSVESQEQIVINCVCEVYLASQIDF